MVEENIPLIDRLRAGEIVTCEKCHKGHFDNNFENADKSNYFHCDTCDNFIHIQPNITVE